MKTSSIENLSNGKYFMNSYIIDANTSNTQC